MDYENKVREHAKQMNPSKSIKLQDFISAAY
jgi:hypothetical protein